MTSIRFAVEGVAIHEIDKLTVVEIAVGVGELGAAVEVLGDALDRLATFVLIEPEEGAAGIGTTIEEGPVEPQHPAMAFVQLVDRRHVVESHHLPLGLGRSGRSE